MVQILPTSSGDRSFLNPGNGSPLRTFANTLRPLRFKFLSRCSSGNKFKPQRTQSIRKGPQRTPHW
jgi:hypothetical protein